MKKKFKIVLAVLVVILGGYIYLMGGVNRTIEKVKNGQYLNFTFINKSEESINNTSNPNTKKCLYVRALVSKNNKYEFEWYEVYCNNENEAKKIFDKLHGNRISRQSFKQIKLQSSIDDISRYYGEELEIKDLESNGYYVVSITISENNDDDLY